MTLFTNQIHYYIVDRVLVYNSEYLDPNGGRVSLQNKVIFDIHYFFYQHGGENLEIKKRDWFELRYDEKIDHEYVIKVCDECTKNHKEVNQPLNSIMRMLQDVGTYFWQISAFKCNFGPICGL